MSAPPAVRPGSAAAWKLALRPRTLWIAVVPVAVGAAFAQRHTGGIDPAAAALALAISLLLQAIVNLHNDVGYTVRGGEHRDRVGARQGWPRATAIGALSIRAVRFAIALAVALTLAVGVPLVLRAGWPAAAIGVASIAAALGYMGGPRPIAYTPFGELTVIAFFGWAATAGTFYVLTLTLAPGVLMAATAIGMLAGAVLAANNLRDAQHDRASGRRTFAVLFGARAALRLYVLLLWAPFAVTALLAAYERTPAMLAPLGLAPVAWRLTARMRTALRGAEQTAALAATVRLELGFGLLAAAAALL